MRYLISLILIIIFSSYNHQAYAAGGIINKIIIQDNQRIEESTILSYIDVKEGDLFDQKKINSSLKKMFATGLFSDISVLRENKALIIKVVENPIINKITLEGSKKISEDSILSEINLKSRDVYTRSKVQRDTKKIQDMYHKSGRFSATVEPKVVKLDQNRVDLIFEIDEGKKTTVGKINFIGNKYFDDNKLKKIINTKESRWYSFYSGNDTYDTDKVAFDKELLRKFYVSKGYADFRVISSTAEITQNKKHFILSFTMEEGEKYKFGEMKVSSSLPDVTIDDFSKIIVTKKDEIFNSDLIDDTIEAMTNDLNDKGYAFVDINAQYERNPDDMIMGITYRIAEGPKVYIDEINIQGNVRTLDKVIRREFRISEGDPFNAAKIRRSQQRIRNLGFFDNVEVSNERTDVSDKADINVEVAEKSTGDLTFGAGYSTNDGMLGNISIRERNLLGKGQDLRLGLQNSQAGLTIDVGFTEPYFMGRDLATGFDVWNTSSTRTDNAVSSVDSSGFSLRSSYSLTEHLRHTLRYTIKTDTLTNITDYASAVVKSQAGTTSASIIGQSFMYDKRDNRFATTDGYYVWFDQKLAGLGGNLKYIRHELKAGYFKPVYNEDFILKLTASGGHISGYGGKNVRFADNFRLTGRNVRGFETIGFGPTDFTSSVEGTVLGGKRYYAGSIELEVPIFFMPDELDFTGFFFNDFGSITGLDVNNPRIIDRDSLHASAGIGFSWVSPLGPLNVSYAFPYLKESIDKTQKLQFDFGTKF